MSTQYEEETFWKVVNMNGKGKCVIAKIDILAGTLILTEVPIFTVPQDVHESVLEVITIIKE